MQLTHDSLTLWYGTPDAPAPLGSEEDRSGVSVTVAASPSNPSNTVSVRYRVDRGLVQTVRAVRTRTDLSRGADYFRATLPDFWSGDTVAYLPVLTCAGRRSPDPETATTLPSSFRLAAARPTPTNSLRARMIPQAATDWAPGPERQPFALDYLASIRVPLKAPELIGETPEGIKVNWFWYPAEGVVVGPKLNAKVRRMGGDWMTIRRDGVGVMDVRATLETSDGALLYVSYLGYFDLGENGYQDFLRRRWPNRAPTRTTPRFSAAHPNYRWLNRVPCLGIGEVRMDELVYIYDMYAVR
jgi:Protein of unknown function (DUF3237)